MEKEKSEKHAKSSKDSKSSKSIKETKEANQKRESKDSKESEKERNARDSKRSKERTRHERDERSERKSRSEREGRSERKSKGEHDERREREHAGHSIHDRRSEHDKKGERESRRDRESHCERDSKHKRHSRSAHESKTKDKSKSHSESRSEHESKSKKEHTKSTKDVKEDKKECTSKDKKLKNNMKEVSEEDKGTVATENNKTATEDIKDLIMRALECELGGHILEARMLYEESLAKLESCSTDENKEEMSDSYRKYLNTYERHVQRLRDQIDQSMFSCKIIEHITIPEGVRGRSFQKLYGCYLNDKVSLVHIYEPNLTHNTQLEHLINFVEVVIKNCSNLMFVRVITRPSPKSIQLQTEVLHGLREEVEAGNISFNYHFDEQVLKPRIILNSGVVIRCRRGLHIYKPMSKYYKLGLYDYDFRRCESCEIDVYQGKPFSESISKADRTDLMESMLHD